MLDKTANSVTYGGGDNQSVFPIPFPFLETSHIEAVLVDAGGAAVTLSAGTDFILNRISDGDGEFILLGEKALARNDRLIIRRIVPLTQEILFHGQGPNSPQATEEGLDKLTMIAQQLDAAVSRRLEAPEGTEPGAVLRNLMDSLEDVGEIGAALEATNRELGGKADARHSHAWNEIAGLQQQLADKADIAAVARKADSDFVHLALAEKAGIQHGHVVSDVSGLPGILDSKASLTALAGKAPLAHAHPMTDVRDLDQTLAGKADVALLANYSERRHAAAHAAGGGDPLAPEDIGCLSSPPPDGKTYLAVNGGWVEYIASGGGTGEGGGTLDHSQLVNRFAADQHSQGAIQHLTRDLDLIRGDISALGTTAAALASGLEDKAGRDELPGPATGEADGLLSAADKRKLDNLSSNPENLASLAYVDDELAARDSRLAVLESTRPADAPADGGAYVRKNGQWAAMATGMVGEIRLLPFRSADLPGGWYFCNGDRYALSSAQGKALSALPAAFKTDWGVAVSGNTISLPNLFNGSDGYFLRPVDNSGRQPGSVQADAIRNITGSVMSQSGNSIGVISRSGGYPGVVSGAFTKGADTMYSVGMASSAGSELAFDASRSVPTATENRPVNIGMTPSIYLGV